MRFLDFAWPESYDRRMVTRALSVVLLLATGAGAVAGQSLADVARAEAERRRATTAPAKVYTNEDLRPEPNPSTATPAPAEGSAAAPAPPPSAADGGGDADPTGKPAAPGDASAAPPRPAVRNQEYWASRMTEARNKVERSRSFAQALQNRIDMLWTDFVNRGDPVQQRALEQDRNKAIAELEQLKIEIAENERAVVEIEEEARREGVPPGWLRP